MYTTRETIEGDYLVPSKMRFYGVLGSLGFVLDVQN